MNEKSNDLIVTNIEETPLSQGQTVTGLQEQINSDEARMRNLKLQTIIGYSLSGALTLGGMIACIATNNPWFFLGGITAASFPGVMGASAGKTLSYYRLFNSRPEQPLSNEETTGGMNK